MDDCFFNGFMTCIATMGVSVVLYVIASHVYHKTKSKDRKAAYDPTKL